MGAFIRKWAAGFRLGRLPEAGRAQLEAEGRLLYLAEGIWQTVSFRHLRTPNRYHRYYRFAWFGFFALSERRLVTRAKCGHDIHVNLAYDDARFQQIVFAVRPKYLSLALDASLLSSQMSGPVELRLHLPDIAAAARILEQAGARIMENGR